MFALIVDVVFRPIFGIKEAMEKATIWDTVCIMLIVIVANILSLHLSLANILYYFSIGISFYVLFYGSLITSGAMYLGKKMFFKNNYAYPYVLLPFSFLSSVYITFSSSDRQYLLIAFIFVWEIFLEFIYTLNTFKYDNGDLGVLRAMFIVLYSYLMRVFVLSIIFISNKFYWTI